MTETLEVTGLIITAQRSACLQAFHLERATGEAVVQVELCGVCTPEQRVFRGVRREYPYWGGHELCGLVEEPGTDGVAIAPGSRVAVALMPRCGCCRACREGRDNHCAYIHPLARGGLPAGPRGFSDRVIVPPYMLYPVGPNLPAQAAALVEPVACVARSVEMAAPEPGALAVVFGAGTMGLLHIALLVRSGCRVIAVCTPNEISRARAAGARAAVPPETLPDALDEESARWGSDLAFCTRGGTQAVQQALATSGRGGRIVLYESLSGTKTAPVDLNDMHYREIRLIGTIAHSTKDLTRAVRLLQADPGIAEVLRVETIPAGEGEAALARAIDPEVNRVMINFRE